MNDYNFVGPFKEIALLYIEYKKSLGYDSKSELAELKKMDKYFFDKNITNVQLTKNMVEDYAAKRKDETFGTQAKRLSLLKQFATYLKKMGYEDIYIHSIKTHKSTSNFRPYIYSEEELKKIFKYLDDNQYNNEKKINNCVLPTFIRMIWSCGLRRNEAINLKNEDIDLEKKIITINNGKGNVTRIVPISESLANACKIYKSRFPSNSDYFFCNYKGKKLSHHITEYFQQILKELKILRADGTPPRIHDLRFTFAVMALEKMDKAGIKEILSLPKTSIENGVRDLAILTLLYDSGARVQELVNIKTKDIDFNKKTVYLFGKGRKARIVPLISQTIKILEKYIKIYNIPINSDNLLFYNSQKGALTKEVFINLGTI